MPAGEYSEPGFDVFDDPLVVLEFADASLFPSTAQVFAVPCGRLDRLDTFRDPCGEVFSFGHSALSFWFSMFDEYSFAVDPGETPSAPSPEERNESVSLVDVFEPLFDVVLLPVFESEVLEELVDLFVGHSDVSFLVWVSLDCCDVSVSVVCASE